MSKIKVKYYPYGHDCEDASKIVGEYSTIEKACEESSNAARNMGICTEVDTSEVIEESLLTRGYYLFLSSPKEFVLIS